MKKWYKFTGLAGIVVALLASLGHGVSFYYHGEAAGRWVGLDIAWQCWSLALFFMLIIKPRFALEDWGWAAWMGLLISMGDPLANVVHPWLIEHGLYPSFWGRGNSDQQSPQYARLLVWSTLALLAWGRLMHAKVWARSAASSIALLGASSVMLTTLIFHVPMVWLSADHESQLKHASKKAVMDLSTQGFLGYCEATGARCAYKEQVEGFIGSLPMSAQAHARQTLRAVSTSGAGAFASWRQATEKDTFNRLPSMMAAIGVSKSGELRMWVDLVQTPHTLELGEKMFAWLSLWAHGVWLWGAMFLAFWHDRRRGLRGQVC